MLKKRHYIVKILACSLAIIFIFALGACKDKALESSPAIKKFAPRAPQGKVLPGAQSEKKEGSSQTYTYNPIGKPDPFQPFISEKPGPKRNAKSLGMPLSNMEPGQLILTGIVSTKDPVALVQDSAGKGYILHLGTRVGTKQGTVTGIFPSHIIITEKVKDFTGKLRDKPTVLKISAAAEGET